MGAEADQRERVIGLVRRFLRRARLEEGIVFGSRVRGDYLMASDVDLIVVSQAFEGVRVLDRVRQLLDCWDGTEDLEVLPYTPAEFERARGSSGVIQAALTYGIRVRAADWPEQARAAERGQQEGIET